MPKTTGSNGSAKMPLRRSARQVAAAQPIVTVPQPVVPAKQDKKPVKKPTKRPATQAVDEAATKKRRTVANAVASQRNSSASPDDKLSSLPFDIFTLIMDEVKKLDATSLSKLGRTCRRFHSLLMPLVHKRVAVSAPYHAHIAHAIKTLQGHLSIGQNRQLKREGKYKGQRETFPRGLDEWLIPSSAQFVTQLISGIVDPGKKHRYIVIRYLEESLRNMRNIEIFESFDLTESMAESLAEQKHLKALHLHIKGVEEEASDSLSKIRDLKYLRLHGCRHFGTNTSFRNMLKNSAATLVEIDVQTCSTDSFNSWIETVAPKAEDDRAEAAQYAFASLKSLSLSGCTFDQKDLDHLFKVIDFTKLHKLTLGRLEEGNVIFFKRLTSVFDSAQKAGTIVALQHLSMEMSSEYWSQSSEDMRLSLQERVRFISTFDTLKHLEMKFDRKRPSLADNTLPNDILETIFKHKGLKNLKVSAYRSEESMLPRLSASVVKDILSRLTHLEEVEFAPEMEELREIVQELSKSAILTHFGLETCLRYKFPPDKESLLIQTLDAILRRDSGTSGAKFVWERHTKIRSMRLDWRDWDVASSFGKRRSGVTKPSGYKLEDASERMVAYRDRRDGLSTAERKHELYAPQLDWADRVAKDLA